MRVKTKDLTRAALNWAVAKCEGATEEWRDCAPFLWRGVACIRIAGHDAEYKPSTDWSQGGPITEREGIQVTPDGVGWNAIIHRNIFNEDGSEAYQWGNTYLVAAMRCYVASKLGEEVEVPDELCEGETA